MARGKPCLAAAMAKHEQTVRQLHGATRLSKETVRAFRLCIKWFYRVHGRPLPWRETTDPYAVFVSEVMLQQTQVDRVAKKYPEFLRAFPDFAALARAPLATVLGVWQGMGYNRRALALKSAAEIIVSKFHGQLPRTPELLVSLPGIGKATAASIAAFAFNAPTVFLETNIRTVLIHYFFSARRKIDDGELEHVARAVLDTRNARDWYNALMDVGTWIKAAHGNASVRSSRHRAQATFEGSTRQLRGRIVREMLKTPSHTPRSLAHTLEADLPTVSSLLDQLVKEGILEHRGRVYNIGRTS